MSNGCWHDVHVMIKNVSTLDWHIEPIRRPQLRRVALSKAPKRQNHSKHSGLEDGRIVSGIDFGRRTQTKAKTPLFIKPNLNDNFSNNNHGKEHEPLWVSVFGGAGLVLGILAIWILA